MDLVVEALSGLTGGPVRRAELTRSAGRSLRWVETGDGPRVVLVAGSGEMCLNWATVLPRLARRFRAVAYDRAGSGASDPLPILSLAAEVEDLGALLAETGPAIVVGHSWGGLLAQIAATRHPELVRGLVLVDASHEEVLSGVPWPLRYAEYAIGTLAMARFRLGRFSVVTKRQGRALAAASGADSRAGELITRAYMDAYSRRSQVAMIRDEARMADRAVGEIRRWRRQTTLPDVPLIALSATERLASVREASIKTMTRLCESLPRARHVTVTGSGHYIHRDRAEVVLSAIAEVAARQREPGGEAELGLS